MKITLTNVHYAAFASQETNCFSATVCVDGVPAFAVDNDGHGGPNRYSGLRGQSNAQYNALMKSVEDYIETLPKEVYEGEELTKDIDWVVDDAFTRFQSSKRLKSLLKKKIIVAKKESIYSINRDPSNCLNLQRPAGEICLNALPFEEALDLFAKYT